MRPAARVGDLIFTGHPCTPTAPISPVGAATSVFINGRQASVLGTIIAPHTILIGDNCRPHLGVTTRGGGSVFANGRPLNKIGDPADAGAIIQGSSNIFTR